MSDKRGKNPDAWLEDESSVSRAYGELKQTLPPAHLDDLILAEARHAAASQDNTVIRVQRWRKWTMPAALAATVVFAVPLVIRIVENTTTGYIYTESAPTVAATETMTESKSDDTVLRDQIADSTSARARRPDSLILNQMAAQENESNQRMRELRQSVPITSGDPGPNGTTNPAGGDVATTEAMDVATTTTPAGTTGRDNYDDFPFMPPQPTAGDAAAPTAVALAEPDQGYAAAPDDTDAGKVATSLRDEEDSWRHTGASMPPPDPGSDATAGLQRKAPAMAPPESALARESFAGPGVSAVADDPDTSSMQMTVEPERDGVVEEVLMTSSKSSRRQDKWLGRIAKQYQRGKVRKARRELGSFLTKYPDYPLPDDFPLQKDEAIFDVDTTDEGAKIVPEAASWLRGIGLMAERGEIDQARTQLAEFFAIYPDYPLPADFPLTRADALPIEQ